MLAPRKVSPPPRFTVHRTWVIPPAQVAVTRPTRPVPLRVKCCVMLSLTTAVTSPVPVPAK